MTKKKSPAPVKKPTLEREPKREFIGFDTYRLNGVHGVCALYQRWVRVDCADGSSVVQLTVERGSFVQLRESLVQLHRSVQNELLLASKLAGVDGEEEE